MKVFEQKSAKNKLKDKERAIIKAAKEVFAEKGFHKASIRDIARVAGIATGTFYLYFKNKEGFFEALVEEMYEELLTHIKEERKKAADTLSKLEASMDACVDLFIKERNLAKLMLIQAPNASPLINTHLSALQDGLVQLTLEDLNEAVAKNLIPPQNTQVAALALVGGFYALLISWLKDDNPFDLTSATKYLFHYNMYGLTSK
ncbi:TetR/AcrR family transcriptional regulator [Desulfitibacter alkalitolerans]|uniref:TetR/AcrR family transcriptional regulator n=1 Tax=Desulfitibacter alkalitolerans TaxID=264641 RepID=UPI000486AB1C|nr:TetR/AcrR family transcriptional regulator [Desulfitibacter alkalitolerans]